MPDFLRPKSEPVQRCCGKCGRPAYWGVAYPGKAVPAAWIGRTAYACRDHLGAAEAVVIAALEANGDWSWAERLRALWKDTLCPPNASSSLAS